MWAGPSPTWLGWVGGSSNGAPGGGDTRILDRAAAPVAPGEGRLLVVGLGGGMFPLFLHRCLGLPVHVVELDEVVAAAGRVHRGPSRK